MFVDLGDVDEAGDSLHDLAEALVAFPVFRGDMPVLDRQQLDRLRQYLVAFLEPFEEIVWQVGEAMSHYTIQSVCRAPLFSEKMSRLGAACPTGLGSRCGLDDLDGTTSGAGGGAGGVQGCRVVDVLGGGQGIVDHDAAGASLGEDGSGGRGAGADRAAGDIVAGDQADERVSEGHQRAGEYVVVCTVICSADHEGMHMRFVVLP